MKIILSHLINDEITEYFSEKGIEIIKTMPFSDSSVLMHPDIQAFCHKGHFFTYGNTKAYYSEFIPDIICSGEALQAEYPNDVRFNCLIIENFAFCNIKNTDKALLSYLKNNFDVINVRQGYANCSSLYLGGGCVTTSDFGMERALKFCGFNPLFIDNKNIVLNGFENGFIGGSAIKLPNEIVFFGDISKNEYKKITEFLSENSVKYKYFDFPLEDFGSAVIID